MFSDKLLISIYRHSNMDPSLLVVAVTVAASDGVLLAG